LKVEIMGERRRERRAGEGRRNGRRGERKGERDLEGIWKSVVKTLQESEITDPRAQSKVNPK